MKGALSYSYTESILLHLYREHYVTVIQTELSYSSTDSIKLQLHRHHYISVI